MFPCRSATIVSKSYVTATCKKLNYQNCPVTRLFSYGISLDMHEIIDNFTGVYHNDLKINVLYHIVMHSFIDLFIDVKSVLNFVIMRQISKLSSIYLLFNKIWIRINAADMCFKR
jgi:hypothetical protein